MTPSQDERGHAPSAQDASLDLLDAIDAQSTSALAEAVAISRHVQDADRSYSHVDFLTRALWLACACGSAALVAHLLDDEGAPIDAVRVSAVASAPSIALLEVLVAHGWDVNCHCDQEEGDPGQRVIHHATHDVELVQWLLAHGARVDGTDRFYAQEGRLLPQPPSLLETAAAKGCVETFRLLREHGADLGPRTLHLAAQRAAACDADPRSGDGERDRTEMKGEAQDRLDPSSREQQRAQDMLRFLVDEVRLDVNAIDSTIPGHAFHYGTPINYAARCHKGAAVVQWLIENGADPNRKGPELGMDAIELATQEGCDDVLSVLHTANKTAGRSPMC